jgi:SNF2 family DNA or RNA helicase
LGLNLTSANKVILLDPWYNPSIEAQAIDRVVRIGQMRDVTVLRLYISDSIEDRLREVAEWKQKNTDVLLNEDSSRGIDLRKISVSNVRVLRTLFQRPKALVSLQKN